ncbi:MAG: glycosyltransferase family 39 protein [Acidobacteria bacterium]|nr:glycosyltransferase family 39 protein [Acidobacteriota bacterium]
MPELLLAGFAVVVIFYGLGSEALRDWDEAIYASVALDVAEKGQWLSLTRAGEYFQHKPPLFFWLIAAFYQLIGVGELATRLPTASFALAGLWGVWRLTFERAGRAPALLATLVLLAAPQWLEFARQAMLEVPLATMLTLAALAANRRSWLWCGVALGAAAMIKPHLPILALAVAAVIALIERGDLARLVVRAGAVAVAIALPWHLHQIAAHGSDFAGYYFGVNLVERMTSPIEGHAGPWWYYLEAIFASEFNPWHWIAIIAIPVITWRAFRERTGERWIALWFWIPLFVFSLAGTKLIWYAVPVYPPLAILTAEWLAPEVARRRWLRHVVAMMIVLTLLQCAIYGVVRNRRSVADDTRCALDALPPSSEAPVVAVMQPVPVPTARFYARHATLLHPAPDDTPPPEAWVLVQQGDVPEGRAIVRQCGRRLLLAPASGN